MSDQRPCLWNDRKDRWNCDACDHQKRDGADDNRRAQAGEDPLATLKAKKEGVEMPEDDKQARRARRREVFFMQTVAFASVNWKLCLFAAVVALVSYLLGSVSFAVIVSRIGAKDDVRPQSFPSPRSRTTIRTGVPSSPNVSRIWFSR